MTKIMLVEDDNNLREIYEARLLAEGYDIVSAKDGEEALAMAVKEKPDLIISDVMMPKISGFDMLDILRSTPETRDTKVIMMTALSQAEDKARADKLGADRYLVKSQVTLEDVAKVAREVLSGEPETPEVPNEAVAPIIADPTPFQPVIAPVPTVVAPAVDTTTPAPVTLTPSSASEPVTTAPAPAPVTAPQADSSAAAAPASWTYPVVQPDDSSPATSTSPVSEPAASTPTAVIQDNFASPASDPLPAGIEAPQSAIVTPSPEPEVAPSPEPAAEASGAQSTAAESASVDEQINQFVTQPTFVDEIPAPVAEQAQPAAASEDETDALNTPAPATNGLDLSSTATAPPLEKIAVQAPPETSETPSLPETSPAPEKPADEPAAAAGTENVSIANKKVISPDAALHGSGSRLDELLAKEKQKEALAAGITVVPGATTVIEPGGKTITPITPTTTVDTTQPGNLVIPASDDPKSIAL